MITEFSMTPNYKLVYLWKFSLGLIWSVVMIVVTSLKGISNDLNPLPAALAVITISNFIMVMVLLITARLNKSADAFMDKVVDIGNLSLFSLAVGCLAFLLFSQVAPLKSSLIVSSMLISVVFANATIYVVTKLLNGNCYKISRSNMLSVLVQTAVMGGVLFFLGY